MKYSELSEKLRINIFQTLLLISLSKGKKNPEYEINETLAKRDWSSRKWRMRHHFKTEEVKKIKEKLNII
jgi:hypothetical protein